jgi:hypothetical protein
MNKSLTLLLLMVSQLLSAQTDNYLNWKNFMPSNEKGAKDSKIYNENIKLSYDDGLIIKSGGSNKVNESNLRDAENFYRRHIYDASLEMKFTFEKGAAEGSSVGAAFTTYLKGAGKLISYRFLLSADGKFYSFIDSAAYSGYKKDLRQFISKPISSALLLDGSENTLKITRQFYTWTFYVNGQEVASVPDSQYYPINPAHGLRFLFSGKFSLKLNSLTEDYALFQNRIYEDLSLAKKAEGTGYKIENLNTATHDIVDANADVKFELVYGDIKVTISSPALGGEVKMSLKKTDENTFEKNKIPAKIAGEYEITEFTLDPESKTWHLKASKKDYSGKTENTAFQTISKTTITTTSLYFRGSK